MSSLSVTGILHSEAGKPFGKKLILSGKADEILSLSYLLCAYYSFTEQTFTEHQALASTISNFI